MNNYLQRFIGSLPVSRRPWLVRCGLTRCLELTAKK